MSSKRMDQADYLAEREEAMKNEPIARMIQLGSISLEPNSYSDGFIRIDGKSVSADKEFFAKLGRMLHISGSMRKDLAGDGRDNVQVDKDGMFAAMVEAMKRLKTTRNGGGRVTIIGDPLSGQLSGITNKAYSRIPNSSLFDIADNIMSRNPSILPLNVDVRGGGMEVDITFVNDAPINFGMSNGPDGGDENFNFGFTLKNGLVTSISDFAYRLVCSNGMMGIAHKDVFQMRSLTNSGVSDMFSMLSEMEKRRFIPVDYERNLKLANKTQASYRELNDMYNAVLDDLVKDDNDALNAHNRAEIAHTFFHGLSVVNAKLAAKGIDPKHLTEKQKSFIVTPQTMWDAINSLTWLGSHDTAYQWKNHHYMQRAAGKAFSKEYDLADLDLLRL